MHKYYAFTSWVGAELYTEGKEVPKFLGIYNIILKWNLRIYIL